eukprot:COSAG03_NODE_62_length_15480_cov_14.902412_4_plen_71_part_00
MVGGMGLADQFLPKVRWMEPAGARRVLKWAIPKYSSGHVQDVCESERKSEKVYNVIQCLTMNAYYRSKNR